MTKLPAALELDESDLPTLRKLVAREAAVIASRRMPPRIGIVRQFMLHALLNYHQTAIKEIEEMT